MLKIIILDKIGNTWMENSSVLVVNELAVFKTICSADQQCNQLATTLLGIYLFVSGKV